MGPERIAARIVRWSEGPQGPVTLELYPTLKCNLACAFCDTTERHRPRMDELGEERLLRIVEEAAEMGVRRVFILGGGEPLVARETPAVMRRVKALGLEGILTTNGTVMPPGLLRQLVEDKWDEVHFSVDGPTPEVHDALRGVPGAFRRTVTAACRLRAARGEGPFPRIALHFVLTRTNWHTLTDMVGLAEALGAFRVDFDSLVAYRPEQKALELGPEERAALPGEVKRALGRARSAGIATTLENLLVPSNLERGRRDIERPPGTGLAAAPCLKAWHYLVVQADGRTSPCCVLAGEGESVRDRPLREVWERGAFLGAVRAGMLAGRPLPRCRECSGNILAHEAAIRAALRGVG